MNVPCHAGENLSIHEAAQEIMYRCAVMCSLETNVSEEGVFTAPPLKGTSEIQSQYALCVGKSNRFT